MDDVLSATVGEAGLGLALGVGADNLHHNLETDFSNSPFSTVSSTLPCLQPRPVNPLSLVPAFLSHHPQQRGPRTTL